MENLRSICLLLQVSGLWASIAFNLIFQEKSLGKGTSVSPWKFATRPLYYNCVPTGFAEKLVNNHYQSIVRVRENNWMGSSRLRKFYVNKRAYKKIVENEASLCLFSVLNFTFDFH